MAGLPDGPTWQRCGALRFEAEPVFKVTTNICHVKLSECQNKGSHTPRVYNSTELNENIRLYKRFTYTSVPMRPNVPQLIPK